MEEPTTSCGVKTKKQRPSEHYEGFFYSFITTLFTNRTSHYPPCSMSDSSSLLRSFFSPSLTFKLSRDLYQRHKPPKFKKCATRKVLQWQVDRRPICKCGNEKMFLLKIESCRLESNFMRLL